MKSGGENKGKRLTWQINERKEISRLKRLKLKNKKRESKQTTVKSKMRYEDRNKTRKKLVNEYINLAANKGEKK